jgi:uncharacterized protein
METKITFEANGIALEGRMGQRAPERAAIITHPHPLFGGDMHNAVVSVLADAYAGLGWTTLRFNFRGTGGSQGNFADGIGEQEDVQAAIDFLIERGFVEIDLAGYSFGAWVITGWSRSNPGHAHRLLLVAPPVAFIDFDARNPIPGLQNVFTGSLDDLAPVHMIESALPHWHPGAHLDVIQGADHSFWGYFQTLQGAITAALR